MKYTFTNMSGQEQTIDIPQEYIKQQVSSLRISTLEACKLYLYDEGYMPCEEAESIKSKGRKSTKPRKIDPTKAALVNILYTFLNDADYWNKETDYPLENISITTIGRQIAFTLGEDAYELTLSKKRKPK